MDYDAEGNPVGNVTVTEQSGYSTIDIPTDDLDWNTDPKMPRLDITKYIKVLGDYYDRDFANWKTVTRFSINCDYEAIEKSAFTKA